MIIPQVKESAGTHVMLGGLLCHVEGWGVMLLWRDCLCPRDVAAVGSNQLCGMEVMRQNVLNLAVVDTKKSSPMDSVSMHRKRVQRTRFSLQRNRVLRTRFLSTETESNGLSFYT